MTNMKENEKLRKQLTKVKLELEHYKGFYSGVKAMLTILQEDKRNSFIDKLEKGEEENGIKNIK